MQLKGRVVDEELYCKEELLVTETVVPITTDNLEQCIELYIKVFNNQPWNESWSYETAKERLTDILHTPKFTGFLLKNNETPIGFIAGNSKKTYQGITFYVAELCISNEIQGKGYGSKLLQFLEKELLKKNVKSIYLLTSNGGFAENFYRKNGYVVNNNRIVMNKSF
jgi:aminoglycoside 6'-N-acetyltransferase I